MKFEVDLPRDEKIADIQAELKSLEYKVELKLVRDTQAALVRLLEKLTTLEQSTSTTVEADVATIEHGTLCFWRSAPPNRSLVRAFAAGEWKRLREVT